MVFLGANAATVNRRGKGLHKVRHIDVDHLWVQEQHARRMLPLTKIPGTTNPAGLMTTHLGETDIINYLGILGLELPQGRARSAAQLHTVTVGPQGNSRTTADSWDQGSNKHILRRHHGNWWRELFTPMRVKCGPASGCELEGRRVATGVRRDGRNFELVDVWEDQTAAPRLQPFDWKGHACLFQACWVWM